MPGFYAIEYAVAPEKGKIKTIDNFFQAKKEMKDSNEKRIILF